MSAIGAASISNGNRIFSYSVIVYSFGNPIVAVFFWFDNVMIILFRYTVLNFREDNPLAGIAYSFFRLPCEAIRRIIPFKFFQLEFIDLSTCWQCVIHCFLGGKTFGCGS